MASAARRQLQSYVIDFLEREGCGHQARELEARWGVLPGPVRTANGLLLDWWVQFWRKEGLRQEAAQQSKEGGGGGQHEQAASPKALCHSAGGTQPCSGGAQASLSRVVQSPSPRRPPLRMDSGMTASSKQPHSSEGSGDSPPPRCGGGGGGAPATAAVPPAAPPPCTSGAGAAAAAESKEMLQPAAQQRARHHQRHRRPVSGDPIAALLARYKAAGAQRQQQRQRQPHQQQQAAQRQRHAEQPSPGSSAAQGQHPDATPPAAEPGARAGPAQSAAAAPTAAAQPASQQESAGECGPGSAAAGPAPGGPAAPRAPGVAQQASTAVLHGYLQLAKQQAEAQQRLYPWGRGRGRPPPGQQRAAGRRRPRSASADSGDDTDGRGGGGGPPKRARSGARGRLPPGAYALLAQEHVRGLGAAQRVQVPQYYRRRMLDEDTDTEDEDWSPDCEVDGEGGAELEAAHQLRQRQAHLCRLQKRQRQQQPAQQAQQAQQQLQRAAPAAGGTQRPLGPPGGSSAGAGAGTDLRAPAHLIQDFPDIPEDLLALDDGLDLFGAGPGMAAWELPAAPAVAAAAAEAPATGAVVAGAPPAAASGSALARTASDLRGLFDDPFDTLLPLPLVPPW